MEKLTVIPAKAGIQNPTFPQVPKTRGGGEDHKLRAGNVTK